MENTLLLAPATDHALSQHILVGTEISLLIR